MEHVRDSTRNLQLLSELLLTSPSLSEASRHPPSIEGYSSGTWEAVSTLDITDLEALGALAVTNHVILRSFTPLQRLLADVGNSQAAERTAHAVQRETARIDHALTFLEQICSALEQGGCPVTVIKSLDHWPDLGSDLDLYTDADAAKVVELMGTHFNAKLGERS